MASEMFYDVYNKITRTKLVDYEKKSTLAKTLTWVDLIGFGVGCVVGAGIFVLTGFAAAESAGPAISISFAFDFFATALSALCYTEFAARHPVAGSAYIYAYISVGEIWAFVVGWAMMVSYIFTIATVSRGWVGYLDSMIRAFGSKLPSWMWKVDAGPFDLNPLAALIVLLLTAYTMIGMKQSSMFNLIVTVLSILIIAFVIVAGSFNVEVSNWTDDFFPFGVEGVFEGAAVVFFAYLGFDAIANFSEEVKRPNRDLPIGIIGSLLICSILYVMVSLVVTGMQPYDQLDKDAPLSVRSVWLLETHAAIVAFEFVDWDWAAVIVSLGAFAGLTTTMLVSLLTVARIAFAMSRDGLLPGIIAWTHPTSGATMVANALVGILGAVLAFVMEIDALADVVSIGILFAFIIVSFCVLLLRLGDAGSDSPHVKGFTLAMALAVMGSTAVTSVLIVTGAPYIISGAMALTILLPAVALVVFYYMHVSPMKRDSFQAPFVPFTPLLAMIVNIYMMCNLQAESWAAFGVAMVIGLVLYFAYGIRNSKQLLAVEESETVSVRSSDVREP